MMLTNVPSWALCLAMIAAVLELAAATHFRGAIIQWRPVDPDNFDGRVLFTHRIVWQRGSAGGCDANTVAAGTLIGSASLITCRSGCSGTIGSLHYQCTDFSLAENWSAGEGSNEINLSGVSSFQASYTDCCWITLVQAGSSADSEVRVKGDLTPRADNGRINSSPTTAVPPVLTLRHGATHTITIPVSDADGDVVRCRWAESALSECADVCQVFPATLDQDNCRLTYNANGTLGIYVVALQVEDFISASSTVAMSSVPVQFLVQVQEFFIPPGVTDPTFVGTTPADGSCIAVGSSYQERITARSFITDISTVSPPGLMRSPLIILSSEESYINVTWTPSPSQQGASIFCYTATNIFGLTSPTRCITLVVGVAAPQLTSVVLTSFRNGTFELSQQYDQQIAKPSATRFIRVFDDGGNEVLSVDVYTYTDAVYSGDTLTITMSTSFFTNTMYYLLAVSGVAVATARAFCPIESLAVTLPTEWPFGVTDTACPVNQYIDPASPSGLPICTPCPANSVSAGGDAAMCMCNAGMSRVDESDVTLACFACPGPPEAPTLDSSVPPNANLSWSPSSASGAWSYTYEVSWTNGSVIVPRQVGSTAQIRRLQAETQYTVEITAYPENTLCQDQATTFVFMTTQRCPSTAPKFSGPPTVQPGVVSVNWTAAGSSDPLVTGVRYALYSQCGAETTCQLIDDDIQGLSYDITTLPSLTQCVLRVVVYSDHCLLDVDGLLGDTTDSFTTVCPVDEYVEGSPETCQPCPALSSSSGGVVRVCPCMDGYGRVNESDPSLPCVACPGPPLNPRLASPVPPNVEVQWDRPTTPDMWSFMYLIDWQNGTSAVGDTTDTRGTLSGLEAVTQYVVTITAFTDSTVCAEQLVNFTFNTTQRCPDTGPQVEHSPEILPGTATVTWQAAQTSDPVLTTGMLYAVYSLCRSESSSYQLVAEAIEGLSYTVTGLPAPAQCTLRVVAYHRYCLQDLDGVLSDETLPFTTAIEAPEQPPPPTVTVGDGGFTIDDIGPMEVVVEYVCNCTSVITGETVQVRMKPNETADVSLEKVGGYIVQCAGVNGDKYQGEFSEPVAITLEPPETQEGSPQRRGIDRLVVSVSVGGVFIAVVLLGVLVAAVILAKIRSGKRGVLV